MNVRTRSLIGVAAVLVVIALVTVGLLRTRGPDARTAPFDIRGQVMGTVFELRAIAPPHLRQDVRRGLLAAEQELRDVETRMSTYIDATELSRFNRAPVGKPAELSPPTMEVLRLARRIGRSSDGAFDVTVGPLIDLWAAAGGEDRLPTDDEIAAARARVGWENVELRDGAAVRLVEGVEIDLGGIAKGYAIDLAVEAMRDAGVPAGIVDVGGDLRCFGEKPDGKQWTLAVQSPFRDDAGIATIATDAAAVCTSGNYRRFYVIGERRYSHIIDPRTGRPVDTVPSVTVVAPTAAVADGWATALSVLGPPGLARLADEPGVEAMLIVGGPDEYTWYATDGFVEMLVSRPAGLPAPVPAPSRPPTTAPDTNPANDEEHDG